MTEPLNGVSNSQCPSTPAVTQPATPEEIASVKACHAANAQNRQIQDRVAGRFDRYYSLIG